MMWRSRREGSSEETLLAALGERLSGAAATVQPRAEFRSSLRTSLTMEASTALIPTPSEPSARPARTVRVMPRRRTAIAAAFVATALGLGSMASASASALPGDGLYPIKRVAERVELAFHRDLADRGAFKLELAERRLDEARELAARGPEFDDLATESVREFEKAAADGTADLMAAYREDNARGGMVVLNEFTVRTDEALDALASQLPSESTVLDDARESVQAIGSQSEQLCPSCGGGPDEGTTPPVGSDPVPEPEPETPTPADPPDDPSFPIPPPAPAPSDSTTTSSDDDEDDDDEDEDDEEESEDTDSDEPEVPTPTPTPTPEPTPSPSPTPTEPTPTPTPTEPPEPPEPTDPPTILPEIIPELLEGVGNGVGQLIGGTPGGLGQDED